MKAHEVISTFRDRQTGELVEPAAEGADPVLWTPPDEATRDRLVRAKCLRQVPAPPAASKPKAPPESGPPSAPAKASKTGKKKRKSKRGD